VASSQVEQLRSESTHRALQLSQTEERVEAIMIPIASNAKAIAELRDTVSHISSILALLEKVIDVSSSTIKCVNMGCEDLTIENKGTDWSIHFGMTRLEDNGES
jgi:hypothetical protein